MRVLIVEDNTDLCASLVDYLQAQGHTVDCCYSGTAAVEICREQSFDVIVLDLNLPRLNGLEVSKILRRELNLTTPILMLTARSDIEDKVAGFEAGADDYLVKPFSMVELNARIKALSLRRHINEQELRVGKLVYRPQSQVTLRDNQTIDLNQSCRKLLHKLMQKSPEVVSRSELEAVLWGDEPPEGEVLKAHIHMLRQKLDGPFDNKMIRTVRGSGYQLVAT